IAGGSVATGILTRGPSAETPAPSTLLYVFEHGDESALWVTAPEASTHAGAVAWATARAGSDFSETRRLDGFGYPPLEVAVTPARVLLADPPTVQIVTDTVIGQARRAVVHVTSNIGAEMLGFRVDGETRLAAIDGQPLSNVEQLRWLEHWGAPDTAVALELASPAGSPLDLHVVEHLLRPEELLGRDAFTRPAELAPNINRLSDRAIFRYRWPDPAAGGRPGDMVTPPPNAGVPESLIEIRRDSIPVDTSRAVVDSSAAPVDTVGEVRK
ncbi:MAG: hypothetical protein R3253_02440, partial [Longimicrobiales bacterium]|nr:hypothetical protein [Longimicrobiales bacterium]